MKIEISQFLLLHSMAYLSGSVEGGCASLTLRRQVSAHDPHQRSDGKWFDFLSPGLRESREARACTFEMAVVAAPRPDLVDLHGAPTNFEGFEARCILPPDLTPFACFDLIIRNANGGTQVFPLTAALRDKVVADHARADEFFARCRTAPGARVLELGSRARSGYVRKQLFGETSIYTGVDVLPGENVDVVADAHFLSQAVSGPFDFVYSASVFEHLLMPWQVVAEINKVMAPGALILTQAPQTWPLHDEPWDFFRFSALAWKSLFNELSGFEIDYCGNSDEAVCLPRYNCSNPLLHLSDQRCFLGSFCIARKVGEARVAELPKAAYHRILGNDIYPV